MCELNMVVIKIQVNQAIWLSVLSFDRAIIDLIN